MFCYVNHFFFQVLKNITDHHMNLLNHSLVLPGVTPLQVPTNGTARKSKTPLMTVSRCSVLWLNSNSWIPPFHFHVTAQINADTLYLVCINPGNWDQKVSTIIYPCCAVPKAVNKRPRTASVSFVGIRGMCEWCDFMLVCKIKLEVTRLWKEIQEDK